MLVFAAALFRLPIGPRQLAGVAAGFAGVMLLLRPDPAALGAATLMPLAAGALYGLGNLLTREWCADGPVGALVGSFFADFFAFANVRPLSPFFRDFREALLGLQPERDAGAAILTPGPLNDTYFEHAYIARHLGFGLVEGEDLAVADGRVMVRTISGLKPISVIWRRIDATYADPLELDESSRLGAPGLVGAARL